MLSDHDFDSSLQDAVGLATTMVHHSLDDLDPFVFLVYESPEGVVEKTIVFFGAWPTSDDEELRVFRDLGASFQPILRTIMAAYLAISGVVERDGVTEESASGYPSDLIVVAGRTIDHRHNGAVLLPRLDPLGRVVGVEEPNLHFFALAACMVRSRLGQSRAEPIPSGRGPV